MKPILHHGQYFRVKTDNNKLIPHFWWQFFDHPSLDILIKHNIKETASKGKMLGPFYIPKGKGLGDR